MESPLLETAEARTAKVETSGDELHVSLLQDVFNHLRNSSRQVEHKKNGSVLSQTFPGLGDFTMVTVRTTTTQQ